MGDEGVLLPEAETADERLRDLANQQVTDALMHLEGSFSEEVDWPWETLTDLVGPPLAGELWFVGARPGCGKTTFCMNVMQHHIKNKRPILYVGMEMPPDRLRLQWAAWANDLDYKYVARKQWDKLPPGSQDMLREHLQWQYSPDIRSLVTFADDERLTVKSLNHWLSETADLGIKTVIVDHLHRMQFGGGKNDPTHSMAEGVVALKTVAKQNGIRLIVAAQLKRRMGNDILEDYMPPSASDIKQTGATEQEADSIILLHRSLKAGTTHGHLAQVRAGQMELHDIADNGVMKVRVGKCRIDGDARDRSVPLYLHKGILYDSHILVPGRIAA
jgi:replicative DNA helicase